MDVSDSLHTREGDEANSESLGSLPVVPIQAVFIPVAFRPAGRSSGFVACLRMQATPLMDAARKSLKGQRKQEPCPLWQWKPVPGSLIHLSAKNTFPPGWRFPRAKMLREEPGNVWWWRHVCRWCGATKRKLHAAEASLPTASSLPAFTRPVFVRVAILYDLPLFLSWPLMHGRICVQALLLC